MGRGTSSIYLAGVDSLGVVRLSRSLFRLQGSDGIGTDAESPSSSSSSSTAPRAGSSHCAAGMCSSSSLEAPAQESDHYCASVDHNYVLVFCASELSEVVPKRTPAYLLGVLPAAHSLAGERSSA